MNNVGHNTLNYMWNKRVFTDRMLDELSVEATSLFTEKELRVTNCSAIIVRSAHFGGILMLMSVKHHWMKYEIVTLWDKRYSISVHMSDRFEIILLKSLTYI
jgi:hypothetical protein